MSPKGPERSTARASSQVVAGALALIGCLSARIGDADRVRAVLRVTVGGVIAMAATYLIGPSWVAQSRNLIGPGRQATFTAKQARLRDRRHRPPRIHHRRTLGSCVVRHGPVALLSRPSFTR
ncbi:VIT1/CCC1 transporter family protein [Williamsia sp.]|uniref:VIT1/CCC1 transporter family protein n=1 Tax=Williamsia sp. TaxID=1872085 RepID=UPI001A291788|nr:VIT1/CCC1 transporter family protein [Williamsia sp.]MBJ7287914.1 VIT1/CCC1 transporter family protein [Williamsia sp.]